MYFYINETKSIYDQIWPCLQIFICIYEYVWSIGSYINDYLQVYIVSISSIFIIDK